MLGANSCTVATLGSDAFQKSIGWLIVGVLRHEVATKGLGECGRGEIFYLGAGCGVSGFEAVGVGEEGFNTADDFRLFFNRREQETKGRQFLGIYV